MHECVRNLPDAACLLRRSKFRVLRRSRRQVQEASVHCTHCLHSVASLHTCLRKSAAGTLRATRSDSTQQPVDRQQSNGKGHNRTATKMGSAGKPVMQAVSMSKRQQTTNRMDHTVSKAETPVQGRAHSNVVSPSTYIDASLLTWEDRGGEGVGQYERRRQRAKAAGQLDDVVAQYDDTPEAQHNAELRAAEQEMQDKLEEYRKQQEAALREEYARRRTLPQPDDSQPAAIMSSAGTAQIDEAALLQELLPGFKQEVLDKVAKTVRDRLQPALVMERDHAEETFRELHRKKPTKELVEAGVVMLDMQATPIGELFDDRIWAFSSAPAENGMTKQKQAGHMAAKQPPKATLSRFKNREGVHISHMQSGKHKKAHKLALYLAEEATFTGTIYRNKGSQVQIVLNMEDSTKLESVIRSQGSMATFRLDPVLLEVTADRQLQAMVKLNSLQALHYAVNTGGCEGGVEELKLRMRGEAQLRYMLLAPKDLNNGAKSHPMWVTGGPDGREAGNKWQRQVARSMDRMTNLNKSQKLAVATAISRTLSLWQGPPGTGKTRSLLAYIELMVKNKPLRPITPLLACTDTNAAVDNIVEGLVDRGIKVVRLGQPAKVREDLRHVCLEALACNTPRGQEAVIMRQKAEDLLQKHRKGGETWQQLTAEGLHILKAQAKTLKDKARDIVREECDTVLTQAEVVATTCTGAGDEHRLHERTFRLVVLDEATQATEPSSFIPLLRGAESVVIAGDPKQLPPTVISQGAVNMGLQVTLFDRLQAAAAAGLEPMLLDTQYRMHPLIAELPSQHFYQGRLKSGVSAEDRPLPTGFPWPNPEVPVALVPCDYGHERRGEASRSTLMLQPGQSIADSQSSSYKNPDEAQLAIQVAQLMLSGGDISSLAILTPYNGQVRELQSHQKKLLAAAGRDVSIDISSVDAYQGREADVIIFCTVRCNKKGKIGFVSDPRRFNVAISRPRRGLVVVGSPSTLYPDPTWRPWLDWVRQHQAIASAEAVYTYASTLPTSDSETDTVVSSSAVQTPKGSPGMASTDRVTAKKSVNEFRSLLSRSSGKAAP